MTSWIFSQGSVRSMPTISLRGIMMSSTVACSRSRIDSSIFWWRCGIIAPASTTTVRNSSAESEWVAASSLVTPSARSTPLLIRLTVHTTGVSSHCKG